MHLAFLDEVNGLIRSFDSSEWQLKLGRQSAYAIDGLLVLAKRPLGTVMLLRNIADEGSVPENYLAKIFQKLTRSGIVTSSRGAVRGYALARKPKDLKVKEILVAIEGSDLFDRCVFWSDRCADANPCPLHFRWKKVRERVIGTLMERTTLADLFKDAVQGVQSKQKA
jgi:Rrf2 family protein